MTANVTPLRSSATAAPSSAVDVPISSSSTAPVDNSSGAAGLVWNDSKQVTDGEWFASLTAHIGAKQIARDAGCSPEVVEGWRRGNSEPKLSKLFSFFRKHPELVPALMRRLGCVLIFNPEAMAHAEAFARSIVKMHDRGE